MIIGPCCPRLVGSQALPRSPPCTLARPRTEHPRTYLAPASSNHQFPRPNFQLPYEPGAPVPDQERQHAVTCRKLILFLIGIAIIVICADLYALMVSVPSASGTDTVLTFRPHTLMLLVFLFGCFLLVVLGCPGELLTCAACENGMLDGKKSDASLAIPVAPFTCIGPSRSLARDCLVSTWAPPVGGGATAYHLQWREQSEQEWVEWASSVASEKIGEPYYCTECNLRTHAAYQFRVRAFSAVSQRWGPWSPPSKPTVAGGRGRGKSCEFVLHVDLSETDKECTMKCAGAP